MQKILVDLLCASTVAAVTLLNMHLSTQVLVAVASSLISFFVGGLYIIMIDEVAE